MEIPITVTQFNGGPSNDSKTGLPTSCRFSRFLDIYNDGDSVSLNPIAVVENTGVFTDLVKCWADGYPYTTDFYGYGHTGNIYKNAAGTWSLDRAVSGGGGQGIAVIDDELLYATATALGRKLGISGAGSYNDNFLTDGVNDLDLVPTGTVTGNTYAPPTSISETSANKITITPTRDPLRKVQVYVSGKGTGNWTVTIHDSENNVIGTATVANGSLTNGAYNDFTFSTPLRINIGKPYHIHVTSTVNDGTLRTGTASDLSTGDYKTFFGILITGVDHPMIIHTDGVRGTVVIANEGYIAEYKNIYSATAAGAYNPNKIRIEPGFIIRNFFIENEYVVAYATKGTDPDASEDGKLFYWDGISNYYNYKKPVQGGFPQAMINHKNRVFSILGNKATINLGTEPFHRVQPLPKLRRGKKVTISSNAICVWRDRVHFGVAETNDDTGVELGIYEFGADSDRAIEADSVSLEVLNYAYKLSTGTVQATNMKIGALFPRGKDLYVSWQQASTYRVDKISQDGNPSSSGSWESRINDLGISGRALSHMPQHTKLALKLIVTFEALPTGCTITPKYKINRAASFTNGPNIAGAGDTSVEIDFAAVGSPRYKEIEYGFDIVATSGYPVITSLTYIFDPLVEEASES